MLPEGVEFSKGEIEALIPLIQNVGITKIKSQGVKAMEALRKGDKKEFISDTTELRLEAA